jgi:hypothetical protein
MSTDVSEDRIASIFRVKNNGKHLLSRWFLAQIIF